MLPTFLAKGCIGKNVDCGCRVGESWGLEEGGKENKLPEKEQRWWSAGGG